MVTKPVALILGSDTDWPVVQDAVQILEKLDLGFEVEVFSPHRTPQKLHDYGKNLEARGFRVVIAACGGAAHLAGVLAALTPLPVIGVPVPSTSLSGLDALYSIVQMPPGVPVATVGIGSSGAKNAAVLAAEILGAGDPRFREKVRKYKESLVREAEEKSRRVQQDWKAVPQA